MNGSLVQQGNATADDRSAVHQQLSAVDKSLSAKPGGGSKVSRTFELGQRVVVKDVGGIYQGARGKVVDILYSRAGTSYLVRFDKPIRNSHSLDCLSRLAIALLNPESGYADILIKLYRLQVVAKETIYNANATAIAITYLWLTLSISI